MKPRVALLEISSRLEPFLSESLKLLRQVQHLQPRVVSMEDNLNTTTKQGNKRQGAYIKLLKHVVARLGYPTLARLIEYQARFKFALGGYESVEVGKQIKAGHYDLVCEATEFVLNMEYPYGTHRLTSYIDGAIKFGLAEIKMGMDLAPLPLETSRRGVLPQYYHPQYEYAEDRFWWGYHTAKLGYELVSKLAGIYRQEGLTEQTILHFLYEAEHPERLGKPRWQWTLEIIDLVKDHGLAPEGFAQTAYDLVVRRRATIKEVSVILALAKQTRIRELRLQEFEDAVEVWRSPRQRDFVTKAFELDDPYALPRANFGITLALGFAIVGGADPDAIARNMHAGYRTDARDATQEILLARYPKMGIFGPERQMVPELARNPLLVPAMLKPLSYSPSLRALEQRFGSESVSQAMRHSHGGSEIEYRTALQRIDPYRILELMQYCGRDERDWAVRSVNWQGLKTTCQAIGINRVCGISPSHIPIIAEGLRLKSDWLYPITPRGRHAYAIDEMATAADEAAVCGFLSSPDDQRARLAKATRLFRVVAARMYFRLKTGYI